MTNNDILRRIRYTFDYSDIKLLALCSSDEQQISRDQLSAWLKKEDDPGYKRCNDTQMATFLNGLIVENRGKREGAQPKTERRLNNNMIFVKLKIALNLKSEDIMEIMGLADFHLSSHELSAFFRKPGHKHYRDCKDQILRNFLSGMQLKYRPDA